MGEKHNLSERDIVTKFIIPAIEESGWNKQTQLREEVSFTNGRIFVRTGSAVRIEVVKIKQIERKKDFI